MLLKSAVTKLNFNLTSVLYKIFYDIFTGLTCTYNLHVGLITVLVLHFTFHQYLLLLINENLGI